MAAMDQKLRTLYLMDIMLERTDEYDLLNAAQLIEILKNEYNISADRRTIYSEIEILKRYGLDIIQKKGKEPGYYVASRTFELPELKLLVDAVQSSKFITEQKSRDLIAKLEKLCCRNDAAILQKQVFIVNRPKAENETIFYNVDYIHNAIFANKEITFQYGEWNTRKELQLKKNGAMYIVSPWALTWDDENYYLIAFDAAAGIIKHYRVDKMKNMSILTSMRKGRKEFQNFDLAKFAKKTFGMFGGHDENITLLCDNRLAGVVIDRFGHDTWMIPADSEHFRAHALVSVSPQFFGWLTGIGPGMQIEGPEHIKQEYKEYLQNIIGKY